MNNKLFDEFAEIIGEMNRKELDVAELLDKEIRLSDITISEGFGNLMGDFLESLGINVKDNLKEFLIKKLVVSGLINGEKGNGN